MAVVLTEHEVIVKQVQARRDFYSHVAVYLVVNGVMASINAVTGPPWWVLWPILGWGAMLLVHFVQVFVIERAFGPEWEKRTVERLEHRH